MALDAAVVDVSSSKPPVPPPSPPRIDLWARGGRRSKRRAGSPASDSGISGAGADHDGQSEQEYLALCLLMLSRGLRGNDAGGSADDARRVGAVTTAPYKAYECSVCGKVYASYQALGGHKTSHRKPPTPPTPPPPAAAVTAAVVAPADEASSGSGGTAQHAEEKEKEKVHQCSLCLRTFPSGQALGGHKRLHYEGGGGGDGAAKDKDKDAAIKTTNKASEAAAATTAVMRDFDLNLPAEHAPPEAKRARTMLLVV